MDEGMKQELFHNVDEEPDDLWLSAYVRRHFALEAEEMHAGRSADRPDPAEQARLEGWLEDVQRRRKWKALWRRLYGGTQKAAVFLVVLAAGFVMVFLDVRAVQDAVLGSLKSASPYEIVMHMEPEGAGEETSDYGQLRLNWLPESCRAEIGKRDEAVYIRSGNRIVGIVLMAENGFTFTGDAACSIDIALAGFSRVTLFEEQSWCSIAAALPDGRWIGIESIDKGTFGLTAAEMIKILQNLRLEE